MPEAWGWWGDVFEAGEVVCVVWCCCRCCRGGWIHGEEVIGIGGGGSVVDSREGGGGGGCGVNVGGGVTRVSIWQRSLMMRMAMKIIVLFGSIVGVLGDGVILDVR